MLPANCSRLTQPQAGSHMPEPRTYTFLSLLQALYFTAYFFHHAPFPGCVMPGNHGRRNCLFPVFEEKPCPPLQVNPSQRFAQVCWGLAPACVSASQPITTPSIQAEPSLVSAKVLGLAQSILTGHGAHHGYTRSRWTISWWVLSPALIPMMPSRSFFFPDHALNLCCTT